MRRDDRILDDMYIFLIFCVSTIQDKEQTRSLGMCLPDSCAASDIEGLLTLGEVESHLDANVKSLFN